MGTSSGRVLLMVMLVTPGPGAHQVIFDLQVIIAVSLSLLPLSGRHPGGMQQL